MARSLNKEKKLAILQLVKEKKAVLFGSFQNNAIEKAEKVQAWMDVSNKAKSLGLVKGTRCWTYTRDHLFGQWKSRTLAKRDNARKTGTGGGKDAKLDCVDEEILDILGSESAVVEGLGLPEAGGVTEAGELSETIATPKERITSKRSAPKAIETLNYLKSKLLKTEIYKNQLEILKLERELKIPHSTHTRHLINDNNKRGSVGDMSSIEQHDYPKSDSMELSMNDTLDD